MKKTLYLLMACVMSACGGGSSPTPTIATHTIGGTVTGLSGGAVEITINGGSALLIKANGSFQFPLSLEQGGSYAVVVRKDPLTQTCSLSNKTGTVGTSNVSNIGVNCVGSTASPVYEFQGTIDGANPYAGLTLGGDGSLYGGTARAGNIRASDGGGTIFKLTPTGNSYTFDVLYRLNGTTDGNGVGSKLLLAADGNLYGTTNLGGDTSSYAQGGGVIFRLSKTGSTYTYTVLHALNGTSDGLYPQGNLIQARDGSLFGIATASRDPQKNAGTVFKLTPSGSAYNFSVIYTFQSGVDGAFPAGGLTIGGDGSLYGTTMYGGDYSAGTIYKITPNGNTYVHMVLHSMIAVTEGAMPMSALTQGSDGELYGRTSNSNGLNTIFKIRPSGIFTVLYTLNSVTDGFFPSSVLQGSDGNFYGTTSEAESPSINSGTIFKLILTANGFVYTTIYTFSGATEGGKPRGGLVQTADGHFFGATSSGGGQGEGVIFRF